ncbi:MAG TPA: Fe-S cluster assembly protein HesB, partial [Patescibacteria group bacterium]|nr:Fe-S cluster assembly protein HesB [Patescibacteria group bacterium]
EVMSQQTQINRVVAKYEAWMEKFPTIINVANATVADVLQYWLGLGYNRRALNLKKTAESIVANFDGMFPMTEKELLELPGIGKYTARAILCFAFDQQVAVVDTNIRKIIITQFGIDGNDNELQDIADQLLPKGKAYDWNQALMDYASAELKREKISIPKQSKFIGSHRYYRGQILKILLTKKKILIKDLGTMLKKEQGDNEQKWLQDLVQELVAEGFIQKEKDTIFLL